MTATPVLPPIPDEAPRIDLCACWTYAQPLPAGFPAAALPKDMTLEVPGEIVMQGLPFDPAQDAGLETVLEVPAGWTAAIRLRFGAVYSACEVYLDGAEVGTHLGGFTAFDIDLTGRARPGVRHRLSLRLRNRSVADEIGFMTRYADHPLCGVLRAVFAYALPRAHLTAMRVATLFEGGFSVARLCVGLEATKPCTVRLTLNDPVGTTVAEWTADAPGDTDIAVDRPHLWHPEHPHLYHLTAEVAGVTCTRAVGFRQVAVEDRRITLNGRPILLRGVNHHETHPLTGRADTARWAETDVRTFKAAHVNFLRTSHYPPTPELLDACDRFGMLVEVENAVCFAFGQFDYTKRWRDWSIDEQAAITDYIVAGAREMVAEHGHHPSVILWSVANESQWAPPFAAVAAAIKADDPTRLLTFNWYRFDPACRDHVEVANHHYPEAGEVARFADEPRPVLFDEFAHLYCYNDRELLTDPGLRGLWSGFLARQWDEIRALPNAAGGTIWAAIDDWFLRPEGGGRRGVGYGSWGPLDGWRRAKPELEGMARVWDPVHLPLRQVAPGRPIRLPVENRCDATDLAAFGIAWRMGSQSGTAALSAGPGDTAMLDLPAPPDRADVLVLRFTQPGMGYDRTRHLAIGAAAPPARPVHTAPRRAGAGWRLGAFALAADGVLTGPGGQAVLGPDLALFPRQVSRTSGVRSAAPSAPIWNAAARGRLERIAHEAQSVILHLAYANATGRIALTSLADDSLCLAWDFVLTTPFPLWQAGLALALPRRFDTLAWQGTGCDDPWPDDHPDRRRGIARAFRTTGDDTALPPTWPWALDQTAEGTNDFRSTKRSIATAGLTDATGDGLAIRAHDKLHLRAAVAGPVVHLNLLTHATHGSEKFLESFAPLTDLAPGDRLTGRIDLIALGAGKDTQ